MIVKTKNSVYRVTEFPMTPETVIGEQPRFMVEKIEDLYPGGHPTVWVGDKRWGTSLHVRVGSDLVLEGVTRKVKCGVDMPADHSFFVTTGVVEVIP